MSFTLIGKILRDWRYYVALILLPVFTFGSFIFLCAIYYQLYMLCVLTGIQDGRYDLIMRW